MENSTEETQVELKFSELLQELRDLKLYSLSNRISVVFYANSTEKFNLGMDSASSIYKKYQ